MFFEKNFQYLNNKLKIYKTYLALHRKLNLVLEKKLLVLFIFIITQNIVLAQNSKSQFKNVIKKNNNQKEEINLEYQKASEIKWEIINLERIENISKEKIEWQKIEDDYKFNKIKKGSIKKRDKYTLSSLNRSIIFDDFISGPDISWLVPPGLSWNGIYAFDGSVRGYSRRKNGEEFLGFNGGDAVGQFYYQFLRRDNYSFGLNLGIRSVYNKESNGRSGSRIGEGLSSGFRYDYKLSENSGIAFGGEQLLHFDGLTDTGRDLYATISKGWWKDGEFPLHIATFGFATGKMAEGNLKGLCSNLLGGSGTEIAAQRSLCWAPVFSISRVYNTKHSSFFEYNSKYFLLGQSFAPFDEIPLRGTAAIVLSDHIDNYKLHDFNELTWIFRISLGF